MTCKECIHDGVCHTQEISTGLEIEEYLKEFGCEDYISNTDLARVVRCKDCKHYIDGKCDKIYYIMDGYYQGGFEVKQPNDFCSYGERSDT